MSFTCKNPSQSQHYKTMEFVSFHLMILQEMNSIPSDSERSFKCHFMELAKDVRNDFQHVFPCGKTGPEIEQDKSNPCRKCSLFRRCFTSFTNEYKLRRPNKPTPRIPIEDFERLSIRELSQKYRVGATIIFRARKLAHGIEERAA